ncbi:50S ribosomal protein L3 [Candidatus Berkelbacteria bacterium CG2_30_39_44]|nr:MAG: 50S ribosomal protein L3 [Candidatus Berkelbacteria bacterium CG2_30_39_44]
MKKFGFYKKLGMTRFFNEKGITLSATVLELDKATIVKKTNTGALVAYAPKNKINKIIAGQIKPIKEKFSKIIEIQSQENLEAGKTLSIDFEKGSKVNAMSVSKGKGFQGVIKRHSFSRGPETHGSQHHRAPGSIGSAFPQRVVKGKKMPGQMGGHRNTTKGLLVIDVDIEKNLIVVKGSVAGPNKTRVMLYQ